MLNDGAIRYNNIGTITPSKIYFEKFDNYHEDIVGAVVSSGAQLTRNTDIGGRLLCTHIANELEAGHNPENFHDILDHSFVKATKDRINLELNATCLDCNIGCLTVHNGKVIANLAGEGFIAIKLKDNTVSTYRVKYPKNKPLYHSIASNSNRLKVWETITENYPRILGRAWNKTHFNIPADKPTGITLEFDQEVIKSIYIITDELNSFTSTYEIEINPEELIDILTGTDEFLGNLHNLNIICKKNAWANKKDIGIICLYK